MPFLLPSGVHIHPLVLMLTPHVDHIEGSVEVEVEVIEVVVTVEPLSGIVIVTP